MKNFSMQRLRDIIAVMPDGEIVSRCCPVFEEQLKDELIPGAKVLFNMEKVGFISSAGFVFLLRILDMTIEHQASIRIYNLDPKIERIFIRLRIDRLLNVSRNAATCFTAFSEPIHGEDGNEILAEQKVAVGEVLQRGSQQRGLRIACVLN